MGSYGAWGITKLNGTITNIVVSLNKWSFSYTITIWFLWVLKYETVVKTRFDMSWNTSIAFALAGLDVWSCSNTPDRLIGWLKLVRKLSTMWLDDWSCSNTPDRLIGWLKLVQKLSTMWLDDWSCSNTRYTPDRLIGWLKLVQKLSTMWLDDWSCSNTRYTPDRLIGWLKLVQKLSTMWLDDWSCSNTTDGLNGWLKIVQTRHYQQRDWTTEVVQTLPTAWLESLDDWNCSNTTNRLIVWLKVSINTTDNVIGPF